jgi:hypothetical protein
MKTLYALVILAAVGGVGWYFLWSSESSETLETQGAAAQNSDLTPANEGVVAAQDTNSAPAPLAVAEGAQPQVASPKEVVDEPIPAKDAPAPAPIPAPTPKDDQESSGDIVQRLMKSGFGTGPRDRRIDTIIIHSSYNAGSGDPYDREKTIQQYVDYGVSAHYIISRSGVVYQLVRERDTAYHAGVGKLPSGATNINERSIGIELIGTKDSGYTKDQYSALQTLVAGIKKRYTIQYLLGHEDIAPDRKTDPWAFDWSKLPKKGIKE